MEPTRGGSEPTLGLWDAVSLILGIIIGSGIFVMPSEVFGYVGDPWTGLGIWAAGGLLAFVGALCFAELASTYPRSGGEYVYLTRAFGPIVGYLFAWAQLVIIRPGSIALGAYIFGEFAGQLFGLSETTFFPIAIAAVVALTLVNILGVSFGAFTQNVLTIAKVFCLFGLVVAGLGWGHFDATPSPPTKESWLPWIAALMLVLWTYAGWHEAAYVAAEVKDRRRNLPRALLLGTAAVTVIYLLINFALVLGLGLDGARHKDAISHLLDLVWPGRGGRVMELLVSISALGGVNGMIFTTARIYAEFGADHRVFEPLSHWSRRYGTPVRALVVQGGVCLTMMLAVWVGGYNKDPFEQLLYLTSAVFWGIFLLTGVSLFRLRRLDPDLLRPFPVPGYPVVPLIFCGWCAIMMVGAVVLKPWEALTGIAIVAAGLLFYFLPRGRVKRRQRREEPSVVH